MSEIGYTKTQAAIGGSMTYDLSFLTNTTNPPDGAAGTTSIIDTTVGTAGFTREAAGKYTVSLKGRFKKIKASLVYEDDTLGTVCRIYQIDDVNASGVPIAPKIYFMIFTTSTGAALEPDNKKIRMTIEVVE